VFSDGAAAILLSNEGNERIIYEDHFTAGMHRDLLFQSTESENDGKIHMAGADIWLFTKREVVPQIDKAIKFCEKNNHTIKGLYMHQASKLVVDGIKQYLEINPDLIFENYAANGNTVSSTIPFLLKDFPADLQDGEVVIFAGFGVGLTSSVIVYGAVQ
jgi:3-oxoacyl-[acyl-carrier-protein] synthase-3